MMIAPPPDYKKETNPDKLKGYISYLVNAYQGLAEQYMELNENYVTQSANIETSKYDMSEKDIHIKRLTEEIIGLYRELGSKYHIGDDINIKSLVESSTVIDQQLVMLFDEK